MALAIAWMDNGNGRSGTGAASLSDAMTVPSVSNAVLFLALAGIHKGSSTVTDLTLTGESVDEISALDNLAGDSPNANLGMFAVRNPSSGAKTITLADDGLLRSFAWHAWLVTGVPSSGYVDDIHHPTPATSGSATTESCSLTTTKPNGLILAMFAWRGNDKGPFGISAGWTEDADQSPGASVTTDVAYHAVHRTAPTAGGYSGTSTAAVAGRHGVVAVSVLPSLARRRQQVIML